LGNEASFLERLRAEKGAAGDAVMRYGRTKMRVWKLNRLLDSAGKSKGLRRGKLVSFKQLIRFACSKPVTQYPVFRSGRGKGGGDAGKFDTMRGREIPGMQASFVQRWKGEKGGGGLNKGYLNPEGGRTERYSDHRNVSGKGQKRTCKGEMNQPENYFKGSYKEGLKVP